VAKRQRRLTDLDQMVISLFAKCLTTGEISAHLMEVYGASVSKDTVSRITDKIVEQMTSWWSRPLERGRFLVIVANPDRKGFACPIERGTRHQRRPRLGTSS
jgi:transposase-like protein